MDINKLGDDIFNLLQSQKKLSPEEVAEKMSSFGMAQGMLLNRALTERGDGRKSKILYASELGTRCKRKLWYAHNTPSLAETMPPKTKFKFLYGDMIEEAVLTLAEQAGHAVTDRQKIVEYQHHSGWKVRGGQDAVIDGILVDVKSSSPFGMRKFAEGLNNSNDTFGYRQQLSFYNGVVLPSYEKQGFVAVDKQNGDIEFHESKWEPVGVDIDVAIENIEKSVEPPRVDMAEEPTTYVNLKLCIECSYCPFKRTCWRGANRNAGLLRVNYASGPVWLTEVKKVPHGPSSVYDHAPIDARDVIERVHDEKENTGS